MERNWGGTLDIADLRAAAQRLSGVANATPVMTSRTLNRQWNGQVFFKCENFQRTGSFKFRGAYNAMAQAQTKGVLTYSSGNHAQAIALAGSLLRISTTIVMPDDAPAVKQAATRSYGAEIILYNRQQTTREQLSQELATARGLTIIPPFDHPHVIAGQGTAALELLAEVGKLDLLLVCCGGGGLLSGCAIAAKALNPQCRVIGVEPEQADDAARSFRTGILQTIHNPDTIADGARTPALGKITFPLIRQNVDDIVTVSESGIIRAMFYLWERLKIVVEPTGALATAAILENIVDVSGMRVGAIISGGNVDLMEASQLFARSELHR
ncbi:MAG: threo-3-hydroxy-L-aspartate ammonia-lyase [Anaerolineae bacterium]|nr:threo-3-hydroxy-L-aspartate ammonia-lyase [Gloeobacterales cyanobacterium ES-bin-313]